MLTESSPFLVEALVAITIAILAVFAFRHPVRSGFGARAAYLLWLLVPAMVLAVALPRFVDAPAVTVARGSTAPDASPLAMQRVATAPAAPAVTEPALPSRPAASWLMLWAVGALGYGGLLLGAHRRFVRRLGPLHAERRPEGLVFHAVRGDIGPALVGVINPRIILPLDFADRFTPREQSVVIAHERVHLLRGDAQVNFLMAMLCTLLWFHPLVHVAARLMRVDQELACDEAVVSRNPQARRSYAEAMVKAQLAGTPVTLGCHWFALTKGELRRRIARLVRVPAPARRLAGAALAASLIWTGAFAAWAGQAPMLRPATAESLIAAIQSRQRERADALIAKGADVNAAWPGDGSPLIAAVRSGDLQMVRSLIQRGANPNQIVIGDGNPLIAAAGTGNAAMVEQLVAAGAQVDAAAPGDGTPLMNAIGRRHLPVVEQLLAAGADANAAWPGDGSPLIIASRMGDMRLARLLIDHGANPGQGVPGDGSPLIAAAAAGHLDMVDLLLGAGAKVDAVVEGDETPLINAARDGRLAVVERLVAAGADVNLAVSETGWFGGGERRSPLGMARRSGNGEVMRFLIARGARD